MRNKIGPSIMARSPYCEPLIRDVDGVAPASSEAEGASSLSGATGAGGCLAADLPRNKNKIGHRDVPADISVIRKLIIRPIFLPRTTCQFGAMPLRLNIDRALQKTRLISRIAEM